MSTEMKNGVNWIFDNKINIPQISWFLMLKNSKQQSWVSGADDAEVRKVKNSKLGPHLELVGDKPQEW